MKNKLLLKLSIICVTFLVFFGYFITNQYLILAIIAPITIIYGLKLKLNISKDDIMWIICLILVITSSLYSSDSSETLKYSFVLSICIIIKIIYKSSDEWFKYIEKLFFIASLVHVIATIAYIIIPDIMINICSRILPYQLFIDNLRFYKSGSIAGITGQTGMNAFYISIYIAISFSRVICGKDKKLINIVYLFLGLIALLLTAKRGPLLTNFICMVVIILMFEKVNIKNFLPKFFIFWLIIILGYFLISKIPQTSIMIEKFNSLSNSGDITNGRRELWNIALYYFEQNPLLGIGAYATPMVVGEMIHNIYLQLLLELGIIGFIAFILAMLSSLITTIKKYFKLKQTSNIKNYKYKTFSISIYIQVYFFIYGLSGNPLYGITFLIPYFIAIAMNNIDKTR